MKSATFLAFATCVVSLLAYAADTPTPADGKTVLEAKYQNSACLKLVSFDKLDGQASEFGGVKGYKMKYSASVELKAGCFGYFDGKTKKFTSEPRNVFSEQGHKNMTALGYLPMKAGEKASVVGYINFSKSEKGWSGRELVF